MPLTLPMDIHSHSNHSPDAHYTVTEMCEAALNQGIAIFAITDHYDVCEDNLLLSAYDANLSNSVSAILKAKAVYRDKLRLLTGLELGQPLDNLAKSEEILETCPFDFVLGSLHNAPGRRDAYEFVSEKEDAVLNEELETYFIALLNTIRWGRFDSAAHISYPFRYILQRQKKAYPFRRWDDYLETAVQALADQNLALELNTSGIRRDPPHMMPEARWIKRFRELGGEKLTLGADAHSPQYVGEGIPEGMEIAAKAGFRYLCYFIGRQPQYIEFNP